MDVPGCVVYGYGKYECIYHNLSKSSMLCSYNNNIIFF